MNADLPTTTSETTAKLVTGALREHGTIGPAPPTEGTST